MAEQEQDAELMVELPLVRVQEMRDEIADCLEARTEALIRNIELVSDLAALRQQAELDKERIEAQADLNRSLHRERIALRQQLADAEAKAALADELRAQLNWLASCAVPGSPLLTLLERYDALASPSRDTNSEEGCPGWAKCNKGVCQISGECKFPDTGSEEGKG